MVSPTLHGRVPADTTSASITTWPTVLYERTSLKLRELPAMPAIYWSDRSAKANATAADAAAPWPDLRSSLPKPPASVEGFTAVAWSPRGAASDGRCACPSPRLGRSSGVSSPAEPNRPPPAP